MKKTPEFYGKRAYAPPLTHSLQFAKPQNDITPMSSENPMHTVSKKVSQNVFDIYILQNSILIQVGT